MRAALNSGFLLAGPLLVFALSLPGCGKSDQSPNEPENAPPAGVLPVKPIDVATLPKLSEPLPLLDENRLEVSGPADWHRMARSSAYLCAFTKERGAGIPAIVVKVADPSPLDGYSKVTADNVEEFTAALLPTLKDLIEDIQPVTIGPNVFARYVKKARVNNLPAELQVLATVHDGRMYTVELRVRPGELLEDRDQAYAVAGGMKFEGASEKKPAEEKAEDKPAEPKPEKTEKADQGEKPGK